MLERVILMKLTDPGSRDAVAAEVRSAFADVSGLTVRTGVPGDPASEVWDVFARIAAPDPPALARALQVEAALEGRLAPRVAVRRAWTFRVA